MTMIAYVIGFVLDYQQFEPHRQPSSSCGAANAIFHLFALFMSAYTKSN